MWIGLSDKTLEERKMKIENEKLTGFTVQGKEKEEKQRARVLRIWNQICRQRRHPPLTPPRERGNPEVERKLGVVMKNNDKQYLGIGNLKNVGSERTGEELK